MEAIFTEHFNPVGGYAGYGVGGMSLRATTPSLGQATQSPELIGSGPQPQAAVIDTLTQTAGDLNRIAQAVQRNLSFSVDAPSGQTVIRVVDTATGDTIRQIPSDEALALAAHLKSMLAGDTQGLLIASQA